MQSINEDEKVDISCTSYIFHAYFRNLYSVFCKKKSGHGKILDWKRWGVQPLNGDSGAGTNVDLRVDFIICVEQEYHSHTTKSIIRYTTISIIHYIPKSIT